MKKIQVFKPKFRVDETIAQISECLEKGWTGIGYKTEQFEEEWSKYSGFKKSHFINSATSGLHLAINIFKNKNKWQDGDEIITTAMTFVSTNHAILYEKLKPVFADVDDSLCLSPESVREAITKNTRAIIYVGIGGNAANYKRIRKICDEFGLVLILDAAHMAGTRWVSTNEHVGLDSDCAVFSFQAVKNCPSADAGMICFKDDVDDRQARKLSWLGIDKSTYERFGEGSYKWRYDVDSLGFKYNGNSIMASMCLVSLKYLEEDNLYRRCLADKYTLHLKDCTSIKIIEHDSDVCSSRHTFQIRSKNRDEVLENLAKKGIYCGVHYISNDRYSIYKDAKTYALKSKEFDGELISLPMHLDITDEDISFICEAIKSL